MLLPVREPSMSKKGLFRLGSTRDGPGHPKRVVAAAAWCIFCALVLVHRLTRMDEVAEEVLQLYFQPVVPPLVLLWLWAVNVHHFEVLQVPYDSCFAARDRKLLPGPRDVFKLALVLTTVVLTLAALCCLITARGPLIALEAIPLLLYFGIAGVLLAPLAVMHRPSRQLFVETVSRVLLPMQEVSWADFLLADMFCSLAKSSSDMSRALCSLATGPVSHAATAHGHSTSTMCRSDSVLVMAGLCLPYLIRFVQCIIVFRTTRNVAQIFNAIKYCSAFPALVLTALQHEHKLDRRVFPHTDLWLAAMAVNTLYSFYWDIEQDWDMPWVASSAARGASLLPRLKPDALYTPRVWYAWAVVSNLILRLSWLHRLVGDVQLSPGVGIAVALLEVFRRYQWAYIRVETELRKHKARAQGHGLALAMGRTSSGGAGSSGSSASGEGQWPGSGEEGRAGPSPQKIRLPAEDLSQHLISAGPIGAPETGSNAVHLAAAQQQAAEAGVDTGSIGWGTTALAHPSQISLHHHHALGHAAGHSGHIRAGAGRLSVSPNTSSGGAMHPVGAAS